ncbi:hypothetical protein EI555_021163 [Monodon monoceros]|uniref:Uncharacterized protein n=1 Tax=Monodon monoceros TaxID=40151 RepID=A0A4U1FFQ5_MONMO|nr:hypothetical protein EI555_021163 [Monodon monoceros]
MKRLLEPPEDLISRFRNIQKTQMAFVISGMDSKHIGQREISEISSSYHCCLFKQHALSLLSGEKVREQLTAYSFSGLEFQLCREKRIIDLVNSLMDLEVVEALLAALGIAHIQACDDQRQHDMFEKVLSRVSENRDFYIIKDCCLEQVQTEEDIEALADSTMSHPSWLPPKSSAEPLGHVSARMETTHSFGTPSISVSTQQPPKKFAPVVAPKPKYNPYKQPGGEGDFLPPPPPPLDDSSASPSGSGNFPPPPPLDDSAFRAQGSPGGKTLEERRSSLDAEIDSLTSILADLECSSPYKPRPPQQADNPSRLSRCVHLRSNSFTTMEKIRLGSGKDAALRYSLALYRLLMHKEFALVHSDLIGSLFYVRGSTSSTTASPPVSTPVTGHKRMVIPNQPPLTATKKSTVKPQPVPQAGPIPVAPIGTLKPQPQPAPASYTTASTPSRPTFNVQVKSAQPSSHYMAAPSPGQFYGSGPGAQGYNTQPVPIAGQGPPPSARGGMDYAYIPPPGLQPEPGYGYAPNQGRYYEPYCAAGPGYGGKNDSDPAYGQQGHPNTWKREQGYTPFGTGNQNPAGMYPVAGPKKTYITDPVSARCAPPLQQKMWVILSAWNYQGKKVQKRRSSSYYHLEKNPELALPEAMVLDSVHIPAPPGIKEMDHIAASPY